MLNGNQNIPYIYLGIGSNLGDRLENFQLAIQLLATQKIYVLRTASIYESKPVGFESDDLFYNTVFEIETKLNPFELLEKTQWIEKKMGRIKNSGQGYSSRIIDIDILLFRDEVINTSNLQIPHLRISERKFVKTPLNELTNSNLHIDSMLINCLYSKAYIDENDPIIVHKPLLV
jgi:2-amino-4-hydroxy-6-hydroxymethyldihydropteridine diphosphokinase